MWGFSFGSTASCLLGKVYGTRVQGSGIHLRKVSVRL